MIIQIYLLIIEICEIKNTSDFFILSPHPQATTKIFDLLSYSLSVCIMKIVGKFAYFHYHFIPVLQDLQTISIVILFEYMSTICLTDAYY